MLLNNNSSPISSLYTSSACITAILISSIYLLASYWLIGFKQDQLVLVAIFNGCFFVSQLTRKFIVGFGIFIVFWILFDYMKAFPNYWYQEVHIKDLYLLEKKVFGIAVNGQVLTPNEYWQKHSHTFLNVVTGLFYLSWVPVPLGFATYLFFVNRRQFLYFSLTFLLTNLLGFIVYYVYPAAPPWYVQQYGFQFHAQTPGSAAGLLRFDAYFNSQLFRSLYSKGSNVFAAMPSLHSAYPIVVLYFGIRNKLGFVNILFAFLVVGIWFSAVYNSHHYVADVLAGIVCANLAFWMFHSVLLQNRWFAQRIDAYHKHIL